MCRVRVSTAMACDSGAVWTGAVESSVWWEQQQAVREMSAVSNWHYRSRSGGAAVLGANTGSVSIKGGCLSAAFISELRVGPH